MRKVLKCKDCGKIYDSFGLDATLPHDQWKKICQAEGDGIEIILCANCMVERASNLPGAVAVRMEIDFAKSK